ncbi:MAG TPA: sigma-70 family RNA polymerase sigma factor [Actinokineospora sp.]|nr:sigma-70 family RNA polymerase sigma factor [Actinokineospora sp.]
MDELAARFEAHRAHLNGVAYRMLGSAGEADDAVQETWLRLSRADVSAVANLAAWLTTVVSRLCLDQLRARAARREDPVGHQVPELIAQAGDPAAEAVLVDSVGRALLVVLDRLGPTERVAFVLHDLFAVPFDQIAPIVDRTTVATKKLASRARQRVRGGPTVPDDQLVRQRQVVAAFLAAARAGDLDGLLAVLAPDVVRRADAAGLPIGVPTTVRGSRAVADETVLLRRNSLFAVPMLIDGAVGAVVAPHGRVLLALVITIEADRITGYDVIADPARLGALDLAVI